MGLGLTASVVCKSCSVQKYILQEWPDETVLETLAINIAEINPLQVEIITGKWGDQGIFDEIWKLKNIDHLVMADCFYNKRSFPYLLATITNILNTFPSIKKATCVYHHRK